jgi:hypothetical protein
MRESVGVASKILHSPGSETRLIKLINQLGYQRARREIQNKWISNKI